MRIGLITDDYRPRVDGIVTSTEALATELRKRGHTVFIFAPRAASFKDVFPGVVRLRSMSSIFFPRLRVLFPSRADMSYIKSLNLDVMHAQTQLGALRTAKRLEKHGLPHLQTVHAIFPALARYRPFTIRVSLLVVPIFLRLGWPDVRAAIMPGKPRLELAAWTMLANMARQSLCISPSQHLSDSLQKLYPSSKILVVPNGVQPAPAAKISKSSKIEVVCVGRLDHEKRTVRAVEALAQTEQPVHLTIIGDGPLRASLETRVSELGLADRVTFMGWLMPAEVMKAVRRAHIGLIASSGFDNQPMVVLEYLSAGLPVIYCDELLKEGLTQQTSILAHQSASSLAQAIDLLAEDEGRLHAMSVDARKVAKDFTVAKQAAKLEALYKKVS